MFYLINPLAHTRHFRYLLPYLSSLHACLTSEVANLDGPRAKFIDTLPIVRSRRPACTCLLVGFITASDRINHESNVNLNSATNLALRKLAWQSSVFSPVIYASNAVDGNTDDDYLHGSCSHTNIQSWPWWVVDLGAATAVQSVMISNRADCCCKCFNISCKIHDWYTPRAVCG